MDDAALCRSYDVGLFDLDGVIYSGSQTIAHAAESVSAAREAGMVVAYVTNNASRTPQQVVDRIAETGIAASVDEIITSALVGADVLSQRLDASAGVLVVGAEGLRIAVQDKGFSIVSASDKPAAVIQGHNPDTAWHDLADAVAAVRGGALWVATNRDTTLPTEHGIMPGNGAFVNVVADVLGRDPDVVAGKPDRTMHRASVDRTKAKNPLVIGDRLDTDIEGASNAGCPSLLVMTGVTDPPALLAAVPEHRPTYLAADLRGLLEPGHSFEQAATDQRAGRWLVKDSLIVDHGEGACDEQDDLDLLRLMCALSWNGTRAELGDEQASARSHQLGIDNLTPPV